MRIGLVKVLEEGHQNLLKLKCANWVLTRNVPDTTIVSESAEKNSS